MLETVALESENHLFSSTLLEPSVGFYHLLYVFQNMSKWRVKYYKGLGTSTSQEAHQYFSDLNKYFSKLGLVKLSRDFGCAIT